MLYYVFYCSLTEILMVTFFFFKQKTAYELRISDWSSDVCSSDLERSQGWQGHRGLPVGSRSRYGNDHNPAAGVRTRALKRQYKMATGNYRNSLKIGRLK